MAKDVVKALDSVDERKYLKLKVQGHSYEVPLESNGNLSVSYLQMILPNAVALIIEYHSVTRLLIPENGYFLQPEEGWKNVLISVALNEQKTSIRSLSEATTQSTASSTAAPAAAAVEPDPWDFADPVDILPDLPAKFEERIASKKWQEREGVLEALLKLATDNIKLDPKANYDEIVAALTKILSKDANIHVCALATKCITQVAKGLRSKFANHVPSVVEVIFEKFKEKKVVLRDPLIEAIDAIYSTTSLDAICDPIAEALGKPNPNIKIQTNLFLYRVFKAFNVQTAPEHVIKTLFPLIAKCTGESDAEAREASFVALGAIMKAIGKNNAMKMLGDVANDKIKMERIEKFYNQADEA